MRRSLTFGLGLCSRLFVQASISIRGDTLVVRGNKWWSTGAMDVRCSVCIFIGRTVYSSPPKQEAVARGSAGSAPAPPSDEHLQHSVVVVPMDSAGVSIVRPLTSFGYLDAPGGHAELEFNDVVLPVKVICEPGEQERAMVLV